MDRPRCADAAEAAGDSRVATAPPASLWMLVEHPGPWGRAGFAGSGLDPAAVTALDRWSSAVRGRVVLVRRPGRAVAAATRRWFLVDSRPGHESIRTGTFTREIELLAVLDGTEPGVVDAGPLALVCAHGRHDTCCAVRGRPVAAAADIADPGRVWECSHIGGCRFAPALVLLPHGFVLGGVPVAEVDGIVAGYRAGHVDTRWLRGRTSEEPAVQAAQHVARERFGVTDRDALAPVAASADGDRWEVRLRDPDVVVHLVERHIAAGRPLTCSATAPGRLRIFDTVRVT